MRPTGNAPGFSFRLPGDREDKGRIYAGAGIPNYWIVNLPERGDDADNPLELVLMCPVPRDIDIIKRRFGFEVFSTYGMTEIGVPFVVAPADATSANAGSSPCFASASPASRPRWSTPTRA